MKRLFSTLLAILVMAPGLPGQTAEDAAELTRLLNDFLAGASRNDADIHDRFWAEDLIYTSSSGQRRGKAEIMRSVRAAPPRPEGEAATVYSAEDIRIQLYDDVAVVAFRLVATTQEEGKAKSQQYLNSGTFLKRDGQWRVVNWQATMIPPPQP